MVANVLFGLAEIESEYRRDRQAAGIAAAKEWSIYCTHQPGTTKVLPRRAQKLCSHGLSVQELATVLGISRRTVFRHLAGMPVS
jgi:DNA invertase Pin-like site-specific DNA recombinase